MSKDAPVEQFLSERPVQARPRRLADWINPTGVKKVHSLIDKVYRQENLLTAWERVKENRGSGGVDKQSVAGFAAQYGDQLGRLREELRDDCYQPQPVRQAPIPKAGKPGEYRMLGIPTVYDRVCQQALLQRLEPIFEPVFDDANYGYRRGRSTKDALAKVWREIQGGQEWIVDADLKDFSDLWTMRSSLCWWPSVYLMAGRCDFCGKCSQPEATGRDDCFPPSEGRRKAE